ncbi:hypothetical protein FIBSPDRAFT_847075 [Athelia psychrophila]|uniref:Uncharacterized protein n=1 Tax=Athelia psychrophila TaxID=1759441 RepID=A0A166WMP2_9AGAM|nr:hypothetical protein FIBSPDRAFT_847075 [Fibularhizoctonia sp. CBS 109695]
MITPVTVSRPEMEHCVPVPQEGKLVMKCTRREPRYRRVGGSRPLTLDPQPWTLTARTTAHPVIQAILRETTTDAAA